MKSHSTPLKNQKTTAKIRLWTEEEDKIIREFVGKIPFEDIAKKLCRSKSATQMRYYTKIVEGPIGRGKKHLPIGTEREIEGKIWRKVAMTGDRKTDWKRVEVIEWESINGKIPEGMILSRPASRRNGGPLRLVNFNDMPMLVTNKQMTDEMKKLIRIKGSIKAILNRIEKNNPDHPQDKPWTNDHDNYLKSNYLNCTNHELGAYLSRGIRKIAKRLAALGLKRPRWNAWSDSDREKLLKMYATTSNADLAKIFKRTVGSIGAMARRNGKIKKRQN